MDNVGTPFTASAGSPPVGWQYADEETNNTFNEWGQHPYLAAFMTTEGGEGKPKYGLTILWDERQQHYIPAHGGVIMNERVATAEKAAEIALRWYEKETGLERQAKHALAIEFTDDSKRTHKNPSQDGMNISIESTVEQNPQDRLKAVRQIGLSASSAIDRGRNEVREGRADRTLSSVASANTKWVQDTELTALLSRDDLSPYDKLVSIAQRTAALGAEIEGPLLPPGWTVTESISARNYRLQGGGANVSVTKDSSDRGSMNIKVHGYNTWSGYEGDTTGYVPLAAALQRAQETLVDPSKHLSPYGVAKVAEAKNKIDEIENTREEGLAAFRNEAQKWQATADRYKNALLGERNILLDKHERAFSLVQVDGETRPQLKLPNASLNGVSFLNAVNAEKARAEMEKEMPEFAPYKVWDFRDYALSKVNECTRIATLLVNEKWSIDRESKSLADAKELASLVIEKAGFKVAEWREGNAITPWEYTDVDVGGGTKMTVGASSGGVVSIDGDPFSPEKRQMNTSRGPVEDSIYARVAVLRAELGAEDGRVEINKRLLAQGFRMEFDAGAIPGEGHALIRVADNESVGADDNVPDEVLALAKKWSDLADKTSQWNEIGDAMNSQPEPSGYVVLTIDSTDNAAFVDTGRDYEIAKIVSDAASTIEQTTTPRDVAFKLFDTNGNTVGKARYAESTPSGDPEDGSVRLSVQAGNAAFSEDGPSEVARILREAAARVRDGEHIFALRDYNGNTVGKFEFREQPSLVKDGVIDMAKALNSGRVYKADDSYMGIADGEHRYVVTTPDFTPGYKQGEGDVWLVNAKGEIASGYEEPQLVREVNINELTTSEKSDLRAVAEGRVSFEDFERRISGDEPELG